MPIKLESDTNGCFWHEADLSQISAVAGFADLHTAKLKGTV